MVTLANIANAIGHPQHIDGLKLHLYGIAGEIARPFYLKDRPFFYLFEHSPADFTANIVDTLVKPRADLLHANVVHTVADYLHDFTTEAATMGFSTKDLSTVFYLQERLRRWGGSNFRQVSAFIDVFAPLATRPYIRAAFGVPAYQRYCERIPKELLAYLAPELGGVPLELPWHAQSRSGLVFEALGARANRSLPLRAVRKLHRMVTGRPYKPVFTDTKAEERSDLLNHGLEYFRSLCFDQADSPLWALIDRGQLENLLSSETPAVQRRRRHEILYDIFTLFEYSSMDFSPPTNKPG